MAPVIELAIVVGDTLIALQVSHWNQERMKHACAGVGGCRCLQVALMADQRHIDHPLAPGTKVSGCGVAAIANGTEKSGVLAASTSSIAPRGCGQGSREPCAAKVLLPATVVAPRMRREGIDDLINHPGPVFWKSLTA